MKTSSSAIFANYTPQWLLRHNLGLTDSVVVISVSISLGAIAVFVALLRRCWWLAGQLVAFAAVSSPARACPNRHSLSATAYADSFVHREPAPSGHTMLAITAGLMLVCAVPRAGAPPGCPARRRLLHARGRLCDRRQMAPPLRRAHGRASVGALAMLMLLFTRRSGMHRPGKRVSSASVQIALNRAHHARHLRFRLRHYIIWQIFPGLEYGVAWSTGGACMSAGVLVIAVNALGRRRCAGRAPAHCVAAHTSGPDRRPARASAPLIARCRRPCAVPPYRPYCLRDVVISYGVTICYGMSALKWTCSKMTVILLLIPLVISKMCYF